jgi:hypothetical protein
MPISQPDGSVLVNGSSDWKNGPGDALKPLHRGFDGFEA